MTDIHTETLFDETETVNSKQIAVLKKHFPQCFDKHGHFQPEKMMEVVKANEVEIVKESYSLNWLGKSYARLLTNLPPQGLLKPDTEHNSAPQNNESENLLIKGDNLEVLKHLVNGYREQIKMIYIDPPYNTGSDGFVYQDSFKFSVDDLSRLAGIDKAEAERILSFNAKGSNSHSAWLTFMYPRLYIARELLKEDGVIFISIDDNEQAQLKLLSDEVFGEENFMADIVWQKKYAATNDAKGFSTTHDYVLCYQKSSSFERNLLPRTEEQNKPYKHDDKDGKGLWRSDNLLVKSYSESGVYPIRNPNTGKDYYPSKGSSWRASQDTMSKWLDENRIYFGKDGKGAPQLKRYLNEVQQGRVPTTWWDHKDFGHNDAANKELRALFEAKTPFDTPKPTSLIKPMVHIGTDKNDIVLDFFAGSGTTAEAVMRLNAEDNGSRKFICIQLDELTYELDSKDGEKKAKKSSKDAFDIGYYSIFDITKDRLIKAGDKVYKENEDYQGDLGFKIFETTSDFRPKIDDDFEVANESLFDDMVLSDEQYQALLTTWMLYDNNHLTQQIEDIDLQGYKAHLVDKGLYLINSDFRTENLKQLLDKLDTDKSFAPNRIIVNGYNFDTAMQMELNEAIKNYQNKKSISINIIVRY